MAEFMRTKTIGNLPEHQQFHMIEGWTITDESDEFWTVEKDMPRKSLKDGEDSLQTVVLKKSEWKQI